MISPLLELYIYKHVVGLLKERGTPEDKVLRDPSLNHGKIVALTVLTGYLKK